ncbi:ribonuclease HII [Bogoriella caseilytica]|uniref:Ribonuclease n=1 Tax=Bogoriella caseilytica TaxID=56055 RepID=A0A3N2BFH1_9MICO|nr:ribonuclease HII [Bogoriella caseilytica]ROR73992.1 RNase HII [Bogoriella caseilytica]
MTAAATRRPARPRPSRVLETSLLSELGQGGLLAGMDEVGRGALAGPVSVGAAVVCASTSRIMPRGLADSKLLTASAREELVAPVRAWCVASAVGHASPAEIDTFGIIAALRLAGLRALQNLAEQGVTPHIVLLDGLHDWLSGPLQTDLLAPDLPVVGDGLDPAPAVRTQVKADTSCAVVAAASVLAKVERDRLMVELDQEQPHYGWAGNKGYSAPGHLLALRERGPCAHHRRSWRLPGVAEPATHQTNTEGMMIG